MRSRRAAPRRRWCPSRRHPRGDRFRPHDGDGHCGGHRRRRRCCAGRHALSQSAVDALSGHIASVDLGNFLADKRRSRIEIVPAAEGKEPASPGVAVVEFVKQAVIVSGTVGAILDAGSLQPADTIDCGDAFAAAIDVRSRQFLDTLAPQLPLAIHEALTLAGDDLTRRKFASILVVAAATGHLRRAVAAPVVAVRPAAVAQARLSSMTGVIALDLAQGLPPRTATGSVPGSMACAMPLQAPRGPTGEFRSVPWRKRPWPSTKPDAPPSSTLTCLCPTTPRRWSVNTSASWCRVAWRRGPCSTCSRNHAAGCIWPLKIQPQSCCMRAFATPPSRHRRRLGHAPRGNVDHQPLRAARARRHRRTHRAQRERHRGLRQRRRWPRLRRRLQCQQRSALR